MTAFNSPALVKDNGESVVAFYGSFKTKGTYNVLLEFADRGTLEDYFHSARPPSTADDILMFYERFFQVNKALTRIHELKPEKDVKGFDILQGYHFPCRKFAAKNVSDKQQVAPGRRPKQYTCLQWQEHKPLRCRIQACRPWAQSFSKSHLRSWRRDWQRRVGNSRIW